MNKIQPSDISVVVQGPISPLMADCLASIRQHLPGAEIVLSTYVGSDIAGLPYDLLVESVDPGAVIYLDSIKRANNVNRQITTTRAGLLAATRPYAIKFRGDMTFTGTGFLSYFGKFNERADDWRILNERVVSCTIYACNPRRFWPFCFHPSDWFFFGLREDVLNIWDIPLAPEPETSRWLEGKPRPKPDVDPNNLAKSLPEQYIWTTFLNKYRPCGFNFMWEYSEELINTSEVTLVNNLVIVEPRNLNIVFTKYKGGAANFASTYSFGEWERLYQHHCDTAYQPSFDWRTLHRKAIMFAYKFWNMVLRRNFVRVCNFFIYAVPGFIKWAMHVLFRPEGKIMRSVRKFTALFRR